MEPEQPPPGGGAPGPPPSEVPAEAPDEVVIGPRPARLGPPKPVGLPLTPQPLLSPSSGAQVVEKTLVAPPPGPKPPSPITRLEKWVRTLEKHHYIGAFVAVFCLGVPTYLAIVSPSFRDAGLGAFLSTFFGLLSLLTSNLRFLEARKAPRALRLAAIGAAAGALSIFLGAWLGLSLHRDADLTLSSDVVLEPGMREYIAGEAEHAGRVSALLGLLGIPGFLIGALALAMVLGARRIAESQARLAKQPVADPIAPVWVALAGSAILFLFGFLLDVYTVFLSVNRRDNPREAVLLDIRRAAERDDLAHVCDDLERALARDYVPRHVLEEKLPNRHELAERCIVRKIDELPLGKSCSAEATKLVDSELARETDAKDRILKACKVH